MRQIQKEPKLAQIVDYFNEASIHVYTESMLRMLISEFRNEWNLPTSDPKAFIDYLLANTPLCRVSLKFQVTEEIRYTCNKPDIIELAISLKPAGYFSHLTAMQVHKLTKTQDRTLYLNYPQPQRGQDGDLRQDRIDAAFARATRISKNFTDYEGYRIYILNSMGYPGLGVIEMQWLNNRTIKTTSLARTLVDIAVRPENAGGVTGVLAAYKLAAGTITGREIWEILQSLNYVYPYEQVIGFCLSRAGSYRAKTIDIFRRKPMKWNFYLTHAMTNPSFDAGWKLHYPSELDS